MEAVDARRASGAAEWRGAAVTRCSRSEMVGCHTARGHVTDRRRERVRPTFVCEQIVVPSSAPTGPLTEATSPADAVMSGRGCVRLEQPVDYGLADDCYQVVHQLQLQHPVRRDRAAGPGRCVGLKEGGAVGNC